MQKSRAFLLIVSCWLTFLGLLSNSSAETPMACEKALTTELEDDLQLKAVQAMHTANFDFAELLGAMKGGTLLPEDLRYWADKLTAAAAKYFAAEGVAYESVPAHSEAKVIQGLKVPAFDYYQLKLTGGEGRGQLALRLNGVLKKIPDLEILYDPILAVSNPAIDGGYLNGKIVIGSKAFTFHYAGMRDDLRHEIQHAFEDIDMLTGKPTLARFAFFGGKAAFPYSGFLRLDEVEAYLRDLRFFKSIGPRFRPAFAGTTRLYEIHSYRMENAVRVVELVEQFIRQGREVLGELRGSVEPKSAVNKGNHLALVFADLKNSSFANAQVLLHVKPGESAGDAFIRTLDWSERRLNQIEKELKKFR